MSQTILGFANPNGSGDGNWSIPIPVYNGALCEAGVQRVGDGWEIYFLVGTHKEPTGLRFDSFRKAAAVCRGLNERAAA